MNLLQRHELKIKIKTYPKIIDIFFFFGVHPLRMTTTSSSTLKVGIAVAEDANARVPLSATKWALMIRIRNWEEHWSVLMSATASESCNTIVFIVKV